MAPKRGVKPPVAAKKKVAKVVNPLFEKRQKQFGIGGALPPKKDLHRFVKWPKIIRIQRQRRILKQRLKVPPALNQFTKTLDKNLASNLFKMLLKYRPEDKAAKKERLLKKAQAEAEGKPIEVKKPIVVKYGINHVTYLIEQALLNQCNKRVVLFNNKTKSTTKKAKQTAELLKHIDIIIAKNGGQPYSNELFREAQVEEKMWIATEKLEQRLVSEQSARKQAEEVARLAQERSDEQIRRLQEKLEKAHEETENLKKQMSKCVIL